MSLPTSIEFQTALAHFTDVLAAKLDLPVERVAEALATFEAQESLSRAYDAWLQTDDEMDFDDEDEEDDDWEEDEDLEDDEEDEDE